jgi:hypothetical protein
MYICDICDVYVVSFFVWMEYKKQIKKVYTGHSAECDTRQRGALPSVRVITLGKEPRPRHRYRFFAECNVYGTRQRSMLCRVPYQALDKVLDMGTPSGGFFPSAVRPTLGKGNFFAECHLGHLAKASSLSPIAVTDAFLCRVPEKKYSAKTSLPMHCMPSPLCRVRHSTTPLPSVFKALPSASGTRQSRRF